MNCYSFFTLLDHVVLILECRLLFIFFNFLLKNVIINDLKAYYIITKTFIFNLEHNQLFIFLLFFLLSGVLINKNNFKILRY